MPNLTLITGTLPQLERELATAIAEYRRGRPLAPVTVLIESVLLRQYLPRAIAMRGVPLINVNFVRANELARGLAAQTGFQKSRLADGAERFLVREIAEKAEGYFGEIASREGFAVALLRLFREIELGGFTPETFGAAAAGIPGDTAGKGDALAALHAEYRRWRGRLDFTGADEEHAAALGGRLDGPLLIYGAPSERSLHRGLLEHVMGHADVTAFVPAADRDVIDAPAAAFRARMVASGATEHVASGEDGDATAGLAGAVFRSDATNRAAVEAPDVAMVNAADTVREIWEAARACLQWAEQGIRFHEMAVVYRNREPYRALIDEIFSEAGVETYLHDGRLMSSDPLGLRLLALLDLAANYEEFSRADVMEFLAETRLPKETRDRHEGRVRPAQWEAFTREAGIVGGIEQWRARLGRLISERRAKAERNERERGEWYAAEAARVEALLAFVAELHAALARRPDVGTWAEHLAFMRSLADDYLEGAAPLLKALDDLQLLSPVRESVTFAEFCRAVHDDLERRDASSVTGEPVRLFGRRGVAVLDERSLRHLRFRAVYLVGVAERAWPPPPRPDALLLEHERRAINAAGTGALPMRMEPDEAPLGFWLALQSAKERLAISYARADAGRSGKHLPSYFFRAVADALAGRRLTLGELDGSGFVRRIDAGRLAADDLRVSLSQAEYDRGLLRKAYQQQVAAPVQALAEVAPSFGRAAVARAQRWSYGLTAYDGVMIEPTAVSAALEQSVFNGDSVPISASRMETYAKCPYQYFLKYALRIEAIEEPEQIDNIDNLNRGSLIHEVLEAFLRRLGTADPPSATRRSEHLRMLHEIAGEVEASYERMGVTGRPLAWRMSKQEIDEDLDRWYDEEVKEIARSGMRPGAFETRFGPASGYGTEDAALSSDEPLSLTIGGRTLQFLGRIDRIDWDATRTRFRVMDYKTGKYSMKLADVLKGGSLLQLPLYVHAASRALGLPPSAGEAQYFYPTTRGSYRRHVLGSADLAAAARSFEQAITTIADGVDGGFFAPRPEANQCRWCDFKTICDQRIEPIMARKANDDRGRAYREMRELP
jgi:hypothetical protein